LRIVDVRVDEGMSVKKGDVLAVLETATLDAQMAQNDASLAKATASIAQAKSNIVAAEARQVEARNAYQRAKPLRESGVVAEATMDQRESATRTADAQLIATRDALKVADAERALIEAQRRDLAWRRSKTDLRAPMDGLVSRRNAKIGALASGAGEPMFRLIANGEVELDAEVPEVQMARLKAGHKATVVIAGLGDVSGKVRIISPEIDRSSRLGRVRILIETMAAPRVGSFARASVATASGRGLAVPASAVQFAPEGAIVQLVVDNRVVSRRVTTGLQAGELIEIRDGVAEGDTIVARAGTFVRDGDVVRPVAGQPGKLSEVK
jgi:RND family efflux transporter MFP subunit